MAEHTIELTFSKSTKGTHVYSAKDETAVITGIYIKRTALPATPPPTVELVLRHADV